MSDPIVCAGIELRHPARPGGHLARRWSGHRGDLALWVAWDGVHGYVGSGRVRYSGKSDGKVVVDTWVLPDVMGTTPEECAGNLAEVVRSVAAGLAGAAS